MFTRIVIFIVVVYRLNSADGAYAKANHDRIIYPGPTLGSKYADDASDSVIIPESCRNLTYCFEKPVNYPQEKYNKMFEGKKLAPLPTIADFGLGDRLGDDEYEDDCDADVRYGPLYTVRTSKGEWRNVIQAPTENFQQKVRIESCTSVTKSCFNDYPTFGGITTFCRQKNTKYEFVVDDGKGGSEKVETEMPSCCVCFYKSAI